MTLKLALALEANRNPLGVTFTPTSISGLTLWLDANDATSFSFSSTTIVSQWRDKSGLLNHATPSGATGPDRSGTQNGKTTVLFNAGSLTGLNLVNGFTGLTAAEVFITLKANADPAVADASSALWAFGSVASGSHYPFSDGVVYDGFGSTTRQTVGNPTPALTTFRIYNDISTNSEWTSTLDGTQLFTTGTNTVGFTSAPQLGQTVGGAYYMDGAIGEVLIYNAKLSAPNRALVQNYLKTKWGTP